MNLKICFWSVFLFTADVWGQSGQLKCSSGDIISTNNKQTSALNTIRTLVFIFGFKLLHFRQQVVIISIFYAFYVEIRISLWPNMDHMPRDKFSNTLHH